MTSSVVNSLAQKSRKSGSFNKSSFNIRGFWPSLDISLESSIAVPAPKDMFTMSRSLIWSFENLKFRYNLALKRASFWGKKSPESGSVSMPCPCTDMTDIRLFEIPGEGWWWMVMSVFRFEPLLSKPLTLKEPVAGIVLTLTALQTLAPQMHSKFPSTFLKTWGIIALPRLKNL